MSPEHLDHNGSTDAVRPRKRQKRKHFGKGPQPYKSQVNAANTANPRSSPQSPSEAQHGSPERVKLAEDREIINEPWSLFVCGDGQLGQLGLGRRGRTRTLNPTQLPEPKLNEELPKDVVDFDCGSDHCIALTKDNKIMTWGNPEFGALGWPFRAAMATPQLTNGVNKMALETCEPKEVDFAHLGDLTWTAVAATNNASFAFTDKGHVYGWGTFCYERYLSCRDEASFQALGYPRDRLRKFPVGLTEPGEIAYKPKRIGELKNIFSIAAGAQHVLAVGMDNRVYSWGVNSCGQLGRGVDQKKGNRDMPGNVDQDASVRDHRGHTRSHRDIRFLDEEYLKGDLVNSKDTAGYLADAEVEEFIRQGASEWLKPTVIAVDGDKSGRTPIYWAACGARHSYLVDKSGRVYGFGSNDHGQLAVTEKERKAFSVGSQGQIFPSARKLDEPREVERMAAGELHTMALLKPTKGNVGGELRAWGSYDDYALGIPPADLGPHNVAETNNGIVVTKPGPVPGLHDIVHIATGTYHTIAIDKDGHVFTFGASDYHQTGRPRLTAQQIESKQRPDVQKRPMPLFGTTMKSLSVCDVASQPDGGELQLSLRWTTKVRTAKAGRGFSVFGGIPRPTEDLRAGVTRTSKHKDAEGEREQIGRFKLRTQSRHAGGDMSDEDEWYDGRPQRPSRRQGQAR
ncbi:Ran exchange factor Prp20/Pim1 [Emericellopsis cladophorae]|uniref:Ran exchange factor Prp20/Pim1 n=1 Tax=Emericellopsis cladophorae TaxID=2686198 RepID=A0A9P9Y0T1_9HYPO|nr:Ran exchange factor Prp20/Pim1 [Emericellopsis cladophorae]KAI6780854.1 Ran exchange factor Prp20/Pim1 [Emericellopsis cladophorae]